MGLVYLGKDRRLERPVAVKIILPQGSADERKEAVLRESFADEARIGASLTHPAIATVFDYGFHDGSPFTVFEFIPGETLRDLMTRRKRLELDEVRLIVSALAQALDFAHSRHVVHRDLKPENIRATEQGQFKVLDLGLAKDFHRQEDWSFCGTPAYASPEQAGGLPCDGRTDQYALAVIAFELLTGRRPFESKDWLTLLEKHATEPPPSPISIRADLPDAIGKAVLRALSKDPNDRFATCEEFAVALGGYFLSAPAPLPDVLREAPGRWLAGPLRTYRQSFNPIRTRIHLLLTPADFWVWHQSSITRIPLGAIRECRRRRFSKTLKLQVATKKGIKTQKIRMKSRKECRAWAERLAALLNETKPDDSAVIGETRNEPVVLLPSRPVARFQLLGPVEARGRKSWSIRAGLQIRAAMIGADAVVDVREERLSGFIRTERRVAGMALKAVDGDGRAELKLRWFDGEAKRLGAWLALLTGFMAFYGVTVFLVTLFQQWLPGTATYSSVEATAGTLYLDPGTYSLLVNVWPFLGVLGLWITRWPQMARPAALASFGLGLRSLLGLALIAISPIVQIMAAIRSAGGLGGLLSSPASLWMLVTNLGLIGLVMAIGFAVSFGYIYLTMSLGRRAWRAEAELRASAPESPARAPAHRKVAGAIALIATLLCVLASAWSELYTFVITLQAQVEGTPAPPRQARNGPSMTVSTSPPVAPPANARFGTPTPPRPAPAPPPPADPNDPVVALRQKLRAAQASLQTDPTDASANEALGKAARDLVRALLANPDRPPDPAPPLAEAWTSALTALEYRPEDAELRRLMGLAQVRQGLGFMGIVPLEVARAKLGDDPESDLWLAMAYAKSRQMDRARKALQRASEALAAGPAEKAEALKALKANAEKAVGPGTPP